VNTRWAIAAAWLAACRAAPAHLPPDHARAIVDSVAATFADYVARFNARDLDSVARFYSDAPDFQWVEDGEMRYRSRSEIRDALQQLTTFRSLRFSADPPRIAALAPGAATLAVTFDQSLVDSAGGGTGIVGAMSLTAVHTPAGWKWRGGHTSLRRQPVGPAPRPAAQR
jgi:ketosteroid isomerase-like protein